MGIKNLNQLLRSVCPNVFRPSSLAMYSNKIIAIDTTLYLYKYKAAGGEEFWRNYFLQLICCLHRFNIHAIFILDGKPPNEKSKEREDRAKQREKLHDKILTLEDDITSFHTTNEISKFLQGFYMDKIKKDGKPGLLFERLFSIKVVESEFEKVKKQLVHISEDDFTFLKQLIKLCGMQYLQSPTEAEKYASYLNQLGLVDGVLSEDSDLIAYRSPVFISKINTSNGSCVETNIDSVLRGLKLSEKGLVDLCIMCGTDYNSNIPKIGSVTAYKMMRKHGSIEAVGDNEKDKKGDGIDVSILNHHRSRELFSMKCFEEIDPRTIQIEYNSRPQFKDLEKFLVESNVRFNMSTLMEACLLSVEFEE